MRFSMRQETIYGRRMDRGLAAKAIAIWQMHGIRR